MKKIALIIAGMLIFGFVGCNGKASKVTTEPSGDNTVSSDTKVPNDNNAQDKKTEVSPVIAENIAPQVGFFAEDDNYIFMRNSNGEGFSRIDKKTGESKNICDKKDPSSFFLTEKSIYFVQYYEVEGPKDPNVIIWIEGQKFYNVSIWSIDKDGSNLTKVFDETQYPSIDGIYNIKVFGNRLFIDEAPGLPLLMYDMTTKEIKQLLIAVGDYDLINDTLYYGSGKAKTFTIAKKDLNTMKEEIVLGKGEIYPKQDLYDELVFIKDKMYFTTRIPNTLSVLENGVPKVLYENKTSMLFKLTEYRGNLYFTLDDGTGKNTCLYKFDVTTNTVTKAAEFKGFVTSEIRLVNGYVFCSTSDSQGKSESVYVKLQE